jgi:hypothetical protein
MLSAGTNLEPYKIFATVGPGGLNEICRAQCVHRDRFVLTNSDMSCSAR